MTAHVPEAVRRAVAGVRTADFVLEPGDLDDCLDLVAVAVRTP